MVRSYRQSPRMQRTALSAPLLSPVCSVHDEAATRVCVRARSLDLLYAAAAFMSSTTPPHGTSLVPPSSWAPTPTHTHAHTAATRSPSRPPSLSQFPPFLFYPTPPHIATALPRPFFCPRLEYFALKFISHARQLHTSLFLRFLPSPPPLLPPVVCPPPPHPHPHPREPRRSHPVCGTPAFPCLSLSCAFRLSFVACFFSFLSLCLCVCACVSTSVRDLLRTTPACKRVWVCLYPSLQCVPPCPAPPRPPPCPLPPRRRRRSVSTLHRLRC